MSLLSKVIEEYLKECHVDWRIHTKDGKDYIMRHYHIHNSPFIAVRASDNKLALHCVNKIDYYNYTEATILPQITEIINRVDKL